MPAVTLVVPSLTSRAVVREVTSRLRDLPGVVTVAVDPGTGEVTVAGTADEARVRRELSRSGHPAA